MMSVLKKRVVVKVVVLFRNIFFVFTKSPLQKKKKEIFLFFVF